jgi:NADPH:quinone reductase-like Zn-dependent oxidoreductase
MDTFVTFILTPKMASAGLTPLGASTLGAAVLTACLGLFEGLHIPLSTLEEKRTGEEYILVLGGASSVGKSAIQLALCAGYKVLTSCSPASAPLVTKLGAEWFSYKLPLEEQLAAIEAITGGSGKVRLIFDAVAENEPKLANLIFSSSDSASTEKKKYFTTTNDWSGISNFGGGETYGIALGVICRPEGKDLNEKLAAYIAACTTLMEKGRLVAGEVDIVGDGVEAGVEAYKYQMGGKGGNRKVVIKVAGE